MALWRRGSSGDAAAVLAQHLGEVYGGPKVSSLGFGGGGAADLLLVPPTAERPWSVLCTAGAGGGAEFLLCLPPGMEAVTDGIPSWPAEVLLDLADHSRQIEVGPGHTMARADPPVPFAPGVPFAGALVFVPLLLDKAAATVRVGRRRVRLLAVYPLHPAELQAARERTEELLERFDELELTEVLDPTRPSAV